MSCCELGAQEDGLKVYLERNVWVEVYNISKVCAYCVTKYCVAWSAGHWWRGCWPCPRTSGSSVTQDQGSGSVASSAPGLACNNTVVSRSSTTMNITV